MMASANPASDVTLTEDQQQGDSVAGKKTAEDVEAEAGSPRLRETDKVPLAVDLLRPHAEFLRLLKEAGATKDIFTKKEIIFYLKEYISSRQLYDPWNPRVVYCGGDALATVFGVEHFTIEDVLELIVKNSSPQEPYRRRKCPQSPQAQHHNRHLQYQAQRGLPHTRVRTVSHTITLSTEKEGEPLSSHSSTPVHSDGRPNKVASDSELHPPKPPGSRARRRRTVTGTMTPELNISIAEALRDMQASHRKRKRRHRHSKLRSSESTDGGGRSEAERCRQSSFSIVLAQQEPGGASPSHQPWCFRVQVDDSDESEVLSIQSKDTMVVKDSSDDLWFIEDEQISLEMSDEGFSLEIQSNTSDLNLTEYEVQSLSSDTIQEGDDSDTSEEIFVVCQESDIEFWADSESEESQSSDVNSDSDRWPCEECDMDNPATQRYCGRCWKLRPGWLPDLASEQSAGKPSFQRSTSAPGERSTAAPAGINTEQSSSSPEQPGCSRPVKRRKRNSLVSMKSAANNAQGAPPLVHKPLDKALGTAAAPHQQVAEGNASLTHECDASTLPAHEQKAFVAVEGNSREDEQVSKLPVSATTDKSLSQESIGNHGDISYDSIEEALASMPLPKVGMPVPPIMSSSNRMPRSSTVLPFASSCHRQLHDYLDHGNNSQPLLLASDGLDPTDPISSSTKTLSGDDPSQGTHLPSPVESPNSDAIAVPYPEQGHTSLTSGTYSSVSLLSQPKVLLPQSATHSSVCSQSNSSCAVSSTPRDGSLEHGDDKPGSITQSDSYSHDPFIQDLMRSEVGVSVCDVNENSLPEPRVAMPVAVSAMGTPEVPVDPASLSRNDSGFCDSQLSKNSFDMPYDLNATNSSTSQSLSGTCGSRDKITANETLKEVRRNSASLVRKDSGFGDMPITDTGQPMEGNNYKNTSFSGHKNSTSTFLHGLSGESEHCQTLESGLLNKTRCATPLRSVQNPDMFAKSILHQSYSSGPKPSQNLTTLPIAGGSRSAFTAVKSEPGVDSKTTSASSHHAMKRDEQALQRKAVKEGFSDLCMICFSAPKDASIVHGKSGHQVCCYKCAKCLHRRRKPCPVCRRAIDRVVKNFIL